MKVQIQAKNDENLKYSTTRQNVFIKKYYNKNFARLIKVIGEKDEGGEVINSTRN